MQKWAKVPPVAVPLRSAQRARSPKSTAEWSRYRRRQAQSKALFGPPVRLIGAMADRSFQQQFADVTRRVLRTLRSLIPLARLRRSQQALREGLAGRQEQPELDLRRRDRNTVQRVGGPAEQLLDAVLQSRRRWRLAGLAEALAMALALGVGLGVLALAVAAAVAPVPGAGWPLLRGLLGTLVLLVLIRVAAIWLGSHKLAIWAWDIGRVRDPDLAEQLRTGLQLAASLARGHQPGSEPLTHLALQQAMVATGVVDAGAAAARHRALRAAQVGLLTSIAVGALAPVWPREVRSLLGEPPVIGPTVQEVGTVVADGAIRVESPAYARLRLPARDESALETEALRGSRLALSAAPLPGLHVYAVELAWQAAAGQRLEELPLRPTPAAAATQRAAADVAWTVTLLEPVRYRYRARDAKGNLLREAGWRELRTRQDPLPTVALIEPTGEVEVRSGDRLALRGRAADDLGLALVELVVARPGGGVERRPLMAASKPARDLLAPAGAAEPAVPAPLDVSITETLEIDALQLRPGDVALVHLEATDENPLGGNRHAQSDKLRLRMFSADRHHARNLDLLASWTEFWTLRLADRLEQDPASEPPPLPAALQRRNALAEAERKGLAGLEELRAALADDVLTRPQTLQDLTEIVGKLTETLANEDRALAKLDIDVGDATAVAAGLGRLTRLHAAMTDAEERAVYALAQLAAAEHQQGLARESEQVAETEAKLMETLEKLADGDSGALQAEAERLLDQLESQLDKMAAAAAKQAKVVPYEHLNAQGMDPQGVQRDLAEQRGGLQQIRDLIRQGKTKEALAQMQALREQMLATREDVRSGSEQPLSEQEKALQQLVQEVRKGVDTARAEETRLRDAVRPLADEAAQANEAALERLKDGALPRLSEQIREAEEAVKQAKLGSPGARASTALRAAREAMQAAREAVGKANLDQALQQLQEAQDDLARALQQTQEAADRGDAKAQGDARRLEQGLARLDAAAGQLREAMPRPDQLLRPQSLQRSAELARQQQAVQKALDKLRQRLAEASDSHPALQKQVGDRLQHAAQLMREAAERLAGGEARSALDQTAEAMDALDRAAQLLDQRGEGQSSGGGQGEAVGMSSPDAKVELRGGSGADSGEAYRRQVLKAMQRDQPGSWQDRLQKYYKAIAR